MIMKKPILTDDKSDAQYQAIFGDVSRSAYVRLLSVKNMHGLLLGEKP